MNLEADYRELYMADHKRRAFPVMVRMVLSLILEYEDLGSCSVL